MTVVAARAALLGMDGFVVLDSIEAAGELFIPVEITADVAGCANSGSE